MLVKIPLQFTESLLGHVRSLHIVGLGFDHALFEHVAEITQILLEVSMFLVQAILDCTSHLVLKIIFLLFFCRISAFLFLYKRTMQILII